MLHTAYYEAEISAFCVADDNAILGELTAQHGFALENPQRSAWQQQIRLLKAALVGVPAGRSYFEFVRSASLQ